MSQPTPVRLRKQHGAYIGEDCGVHERSGGLA
jgi:hypothetical protein